jgi:hypothetical protein
MRNAVIAVGGIGRDNCEQNFRLARNITVRRSNGYFAVQIGSNQARNTVFGCLHKEGKSFNDCISKLCIEQRWQGMVLGDDNSHSCGSCSHGYGVLYGSIYCLWVVIVGDINER